MKFIYFFRVFLVSFECLIIIVMIVALTNYSHSYQLIFDWKYVNEDFGKFIILLPTVLTAWILKEARDLASFEAEFSKALVNWPDYGKFKTHIIVSIIYAGVFLLLAVVPFLTKHNLTTSAGPILLLGGILGLCWVAGSLYFAQLSMTEIFRIEHVKN